MNNNSSAPECAFCGRELTVPILKDIPRNGNIYDVLECVDCEIAMIHPLPSDAELTQLYSCGNYRTDEGKRFGPLIEAQIFFGRILKRRSINRFVKPGKIAGLLMILRQTCHKNSLTSKPKLNRKWPEFGNLFFKLTCKQTLFFLLDTQ